MHGDCQGREVSGVLSVALIFRQSASGGTTHAGIDGLSGRADPRTTTRFPHEQVSSAQSGIGGRRTVSGASTDATFPTLLFRAISTPRTARNLFGLVQVTARRDA